MQEADARSISLYNCFRDSVLIFQPVKASLRPLKLPREGFVICVAVRRHLFASMFSLYLQRLTSSRRVMYIQRVARRFCVAKEFPLLKESVVQPRDIRIELERILAAAAVRYNRCDCREKGGRAENANYGKDPKTTPGHHLAYQVLGGALRQVFSFECVLQFCLKLEFWLLLTNLRSDFCGEFQCLKWKRDYVVGVQI
jgi:hypothetical protein